MLGDSSGENLTFPATTISYRATRVLGYAGRPMRYSPTTKRSSDGSFCYSTGCMIIYALPRA